MKIYAMGDLHLPGDTSKTMSIFGENWRNHAEKIKKNWLETITDRDLVLVPGDISWSMTIEGALEDFQWIHSLPGKKIIIRGNHDYWWKSLSQVESALPPSISALQNNSIIYEKIAVAGARLWNDPLLDFEREIKWQSREELGLPPERKRKESDDKIFQRELGRLKLSLESVRSSFERLIVMLHFPPTDFSFPFTDTVELMQKFGVDACIFAHLHTLDIDKVPKFPRNKWGIKFYLASSDFLDFKPCRIDI